MILKYLIKLSYHFAVNERQQLAQTLMPVSGLLKYNSKSKYVPSESYVSFIFNSKLSKNISKLFAYVFVNYIYD